MSVKAKKQTKFCFSVCWPRKGMTDPIAKPSHPNLAKKRTNSALPMAAFVVFIDMLGMGLIVPVTPNLIMEIADVGLEQGAQIGGYLLLAYALMQFCCAPLIGALSDQFGRRPVLLITLLALGLNYVFMALATSLALIIIGRVISGIMGATWAAANSCIADTVPTPQRGAAFGLLAGAGAAGLVLGPAIGGIAGEFGTRLPFLIAGILGLLGAALGYFLFKETLPLTSRRTVTFARANPFGVALAMAKNKFILGCLATVFFLQLSSQAHLSVWAFYGAEKFGWSPLTSGLTVSFYGVLLVVAQSVFTARAIAQFGAINTAKITLLFAIPSYLLIAMAPNTLIMLFGVSIGTITGLTFPALQGIMTSKFENNAQGELQAAIVSTIGLTAIVGPVIMTQLFSHFSDSQGVYFPGAPFVLSAVLVLVAVFILWRTLADRGA
jgi:MFS transporter, DHA1 family, tetracycline resistance protein